MKTTLFAVLLAVSSGQALADGFYQQVTGHIQGCPKAKPQAEFSYTPLYNTVVGERRDAIEAAAVLARSHSEVDYTPLYRRVIGKS